MSLKMDWKCIGRISGWVLMSMSIVMGGLAVAFGMNNVASLNIEWMILEFHSVEMILLLYLDSTACIFMGVVMLISGVVLIYSDTYMSGDKFLNRFIVLVIAFVFSMMCLILSPNLLSMMLGWDGLGLVSYCLVIYYQSPKAYSAGMLTALTNRIGDALLLVSVAWWISLGGWNYTYYSNAWIEFPPLWVAGVLVIIAAVTKSAQIPFSAWLPAAMAAPTPVSALVHSSTLVTAGVYLLIRYYPILGGENSLGSSGLVLMACLTMFMAGLGANFEMDLKKIIALSTLSQLGLMVAILGVGNPELAFFHLITHALFKALLFMCAGSYIHGLKDTQDVRSMGGMGVLMPLTTACFVVSNMALCGLPFLAGFYSKDLILENCLVTPCNLISLGLFFSATGLTVAYTLRVMSLVLSSPFSGGLIPRGDEEWGMLGPMMGLALFAVASGSSLTWGVFPTPNGSFLPLGLSMFILSVVGGGGILGGFLSNWKPVGVSVPLSPNGVFQSEFVGGMWFLPGVTTRGILPLPLSWGALYYSVMDQGWNETWGPQGSLWGLMVGGAFPNFRWQKTSFSVLLGVMGVGVWSLVGLGSGG